MAQIKEKFDLKNNEVKTHSDYLGSASEKITNKNSVVCWSQSSDKYVQAAVTNVEEQLKASNRQLKTAKHCSAPFPTDYKPEMDCSAELALVGHRYYQELIGVLRWAVEIGQLDILLETSILSAYLASLREGPLAAMDDIFGYLKWHPKRKIAFDPELLVIDQRRFQKHEWEDFYRGAREAMRLLPKEGVVFPGP